MKKLFPLLIVFIGLMIYPVYTTNAQGVGINDSGASADPSAMFDVISSTKGTLITRMTTEQRNLIVDPATGLFIYNTTTNCFNVWNGSSWRQWCGECDFTPVASNNGPICEGATLILNCVPMPPDATYLWTGPNGFSSTEQNPTIPDATTEATGSYSLVVTSDDCTSSPVTTYVTINTSPETPVVSNNGALCSGQNLQLTTSSVPGATYSWSGPNGYTANTQNVTLSNVTASNAGTYQLIESVAGCLSLPGLTTVQIYTAIPSQPGTISGATSVASNSTGNIYFVTPVSNTSLYNWTIPAGATITSGEGTNSITVTFGSASGVIGDFSVSATNGCGTSATRTLSSIYALDYTSPMTYNASGSGSSGSIQTYTVPSGVTSLTIETWGAEGGRSNNSGGAIGGKGAYIKGTFTVTPGQTLKVLIGQAGGEGSTSDGGGGGGTFVTTSANSPLIIAGGGGGAGWGGTNRPGVNASTSNNGTNNNGGIVTGGTGGNGGNALRSSGGGGLTGNGASGSSGGLPGTSFVNGGAGGAAGGAAGGYGGFGGGAGGPGGQNGGGGGGGYSGGAGAGEGGGNNNNGGGGGGSYNSGTNQTNNSGVQTGNGKVVFTW